MKDELISVVVPAYNCGPWLARCLDSLLNQTYPNLEIVVVNDGSTDNTGEILEDYCSCHPQIVAIHQENAGEYTTRLNGMDAAKGAWIGYVDSDDEVEPHMYEMLMQNACKYGADISHCGYQVVYPDGHVDYQHNTGMVKVQDTHTGLRDLLEEKIMEMSLCNKLFRRELFEGIRQWMDCSIVVNGDMLMNYYLFSRSQKAVLEDICPYHYLIRMGSVSRRKLNPRILFDPLRVRQMIVDRCEPEMEPSARRALARMCLVSYRRVVMEDRKAYARERAEVRAWVKKQLPYVSILPKRNAMLVRMISTVPWLFDFLYPAAARLLHRAE